MGRSRIDLLAFGVLCKQRQWRGGTAWVGNEEVGHCAESKVGLKILQSSDFASHAFWRPQR